MRMLKRIPFALTDTWRSFVKCLLNKFASWKLTRVEKLRVTSKLEVPAGIVVEPIRFPENNMWVILVSFWTWPLKVSNIPISVSEESYSQLDPGDYVSNPHLGGYNRAVWVDSRALAGLPRPQ